MTKCIRCDLPHSIYSVCSDGKPQRVLNFKHERKTPDYNARLDKIEAQLKTIEGILQRMDCRHYA